MYKLLIAYQIAPTLKNAQKVRAYDRSHPMARCLLLANDHNLVASAIHHANSGKADEAWIIRLANKGN